MNPEGVGRLFAAAYKDPDQRDKDGDRPARRRLRAQGRSAARDVRAGRESGDETSAPGRAVTTPCSSIRASSRTSPSARRRSFRTC